MTLPPDPIVYLLIGLSGGLLGGFLGIGGGLLMIPALVLVYGPEGQHKYQAAVMIVNVFVSLTALIRHLRAGAVRRDALNTIWPAALLMILLGVWMSNYFEGTVLVRMFAGFLIYVIWNDLKKIWRNVDGRSAGKGGAEARPAKVTPARGGLVGGVMGFLAGLLGIGGGGFAVPLQHVVLHLPLKECIGTSAAVICITGPIGAMAKNWSLASTTHGEVTFLGDSLPLALSLVPSAMIGGYLGAMLTHRFPTRWVRVVFVILMTFAALEMSGLFDREGQAPAEPATAPEAPTQSSRP